MAHLFYEMYDQPIDVEEAQLGIDDEMALMRRDPLNSTDIAQLFAIQENTFEGNEFIKDNMKVFEEIWKDLHAFKEYEDWVAEERAGGRGGRKRWVGERKCYPAEVMSGRMDLGAYKKMDQ